MRAVVYRGKKDVAVEEVPDPRIEAPTDAILRVTSAAVCGSDLHMYEGRSAAKPGMIFGHENMGVVSEVGQAVREVKPGDRVVLPFNIGCGFCFNCTRGFSNACLTANPDGAGSGYGYVGMGPFRGGQAEYLRVPFADYNCLKLPGEPGDELEDDFVLLADIFPTGFHATELAKVGSGDSVAVFGAGPVGLLAAYSALLKGASEVYVVDRAPERLKLAAKIGATPVDFSKGDPVEQIFEMRKNNPKIAGSLRPEERKKMPGVMRGIDAVGYQAVSGSSPDEENPVQTLSDLARLINPTGAVGIIGVYFREDPGGVNQAAARGDYLIPLGALWEKGISIGTGQTPAKQYITHLRDMILAGRARPSFIVSHRLPLSKAPEAYARFGARGMGEGSDYTKVVLKPDLDRLAA